MREYRVRRRKLREDILKIKTTFSNSVDPKTDIISVEKTKIQILHDCNNFSRTNSVRES